MKPKLILCLALVLSGGLFGCATVNQTPRQYIIAPANQGEATESLYYDNPSPDILQNIKVARISLTKDELNKLAALPKDQTNSVTWLVEIDPDTTRDGPWKTQLYLFDVEDTNHCVRVELTDHVSGGVSHAWINDELLSIKVWWGHIAWTDLILNVETCKILYLREGFEGVLPDDMLPENNKP